MAPARPAVTPHRMLSGEGRGSDERRARAMRSMRPMAWAAAMMVKTLVRRVARPPLKSPVPQEIEAARPSIMAMRLWFIVFVLVNVPRGRQEEQVVMFYHDYSETVVCIGYNVDGCY